MSEALTLRSYVLLLLITALLTAGGIHLGSRQPEKLVATEESTSAAVAPATQPLFPGQPNP